MTVPALHLANLSAEHRRQLESLLLKFDQAWDEKRLSAVLRQLPADSPLRRPALIEMIKIDLERRRKAGQKVRLEAYLKSLPELGVADDLPVALILAEYQARRQFGTAPDLAEYAKRFPRQAAELGRLAAEADRETVPPSPSALPSSTLPTFRPAEAKRSTAGPHGGPTAAAELPEQFGRYRILKRIGRGGMGTVYLAHDTQLDRQVALKAPHFSPGDGPEVLERFAREARAAATIDHPNICPVYDVGVHDGVHYVTMAYIEGRPLSELIRDGKPLPPRPAAALVRKLALALAEAHRHGVIHRDLKPSNVMVNRRKEPVIMDFGLARRVNRGEERLTKAGALLGTPAYMPPEQVAGDVEAMGPACDVYSLGVMLYEMLTGQLPFQGPLGAVFGQILTQEPEPPSKLQPDLDADLEAVCLKAMAKKPQDRFASMDAMADALARYLRGAAAPARPAVKGGPAEALKKTGPSEGTDLAEGLLARLVDRLEAAPRQTPSAPPPPPRGGAPWWVAPIVGLGLVLAGVLVVFILFNRPPSVVVDNKNINIVSARVELPKEYANDPTVTVRIGDKTYTQEELSKGIELKVGGNDVEVRRGDKLIARGKLTVSADDTVVKLDARPVQEPRFGVVAVQFEGLKERLSDSTVTILITGKAYTKAELADPVLLSAGDHVLVVRKDSQEKERHPFAVGGQGDKQTVRLPPPPPRTPVEPSPAVKALLEALQDPKNDVRRDAAEGLKKQGDKTAVPALEKRVADDRMNGDAGRGSESYSSKVAALNALKRLAPERATPALLKATQSTIEDVRLWACWELGRWDNKDSLKANTDGLVAVLRHDKSARVRVTAAEALAAARHAAVPELAEALFDDDNGVRRTAAASLQALGDRSTYRADLVKQVVDGAVPALEKRVADDRMNGDAGRGSESYSSKVAALNALKQLAPERATPALVAALRQEKNEDVRLWACWGLGKQKDKQSIDALGDASKNDKSARVREAAGAALGERK